MLKVYRTDNEGIEHIVRENIGTIDVLTNSNGR